MSPFQLGAALVALAGAVGALSARETRWMLGGLCVTLTAAPLVADPLPSPLAVAARLAAALLGAQLVLVAVRHRPAPAHRPGIGPLSPALAAAAAFVIGYATAGVGSSVAGPGEATAAGFGLAALALGPLVLGRDVLRTGLGMALLVTSVELIRTGLAGTPGALEQLASAGLTIAVLGVTAALAAAALAAGHDLSIETGSFRETLFEAHPLAAGPQRQTAASTHPGPAAGEPRRDARRPAAAPRQHAAAHQLTIDERLARSSTDEAGARVPVDPVPPAPAPPGGDPG